MSTGLAVNEHGDYRDGCAWNYLHNIMWFLFNSNFLADALTLIDIKVCCHNHIFYLLMQQPPTKASQEEQDNANQEEQDDANQEQETSSHAIAVSF